MSEVSELSKVAYMSDSSRSRERAVAASALVLVVVLAAVIASALRSPPRSGREPAEVAAGALGARPVIGPTGALPTSPAELWAAIGGEPAPSTGPPGPGGGVVVAGGAAKSGASADGSPTGSPATPAAVAPRPAPPPDPPPAVDPARLRGVPTDALDLLDPDVATRMRAAVGMADPVPDDPPAAPAPTTPPVPVIEAPPRAPSYELGANLLDDDSATLEGSTGAWKQWFSDTLTSSANDGNTGEHSLRVNVSALHGWGVELKIWPGFPASPGRYVIGFAAKAETPAVTAATMTVHWHHDTVEIGSTTLTFALTDSWQAGSDLVTAPAGTTYVRIDFRNRAGGPGDRLLLDDILVAPVAN
jgi:hypothetical protein